MFEIKSGQNTHAGWCHSPVFASVCFHKLGERSPVIRKGQCFHFNIADVSQFKCHHVCSRWPWTHTKVMTQHNVQPTDNSRGPGSVFWFFFFWIVWRFVWFIYRTSDSEMELFFSSSTLSLKSSLFLWHFFVFGGKKQLLVFKKGDSSFLFVDSLHLPSYWEGFGPGLWD